MKKRKLDDDNEDDDNSLEVMVEKDKIKTEENDSESCEEDDSYLSSSEDDNAEKIECTNCNKLIKKTNSFCGNCGKKNEKNENDKMNVATRIYELESRKNELEGKLSCTNRLMEYQNRKVLYPENFPEMPPFGNELGQMWVIISFQLSSSNLPIFSESKITQVSAPYALKFGYQPNGLLSSNISKLLSEENQLSKYDRHMEQMVNLLEKFGDNIIMRAPSVYRHFDGTLYGIIVESVIFSNDKGRNGFAFGILKEVWKLEKLEESHHILRETEIEIVKNDD